MNKRHLLTIAIMVFIISTLTGCGTGKIKYKSPDKTKIVIEYEKHSPFMRVPQFETVNYSEGVKMKFNGDVWYTAKIMSAESAMEAVSDMLLVGQSSNLRVYQALEKTEEGYFGERNRPSHIIMDLDETDESVIMFDSYDDYASHNHGYGFDINFCIKYLVNGEEVFPDVDGIRDTAEVTIINKYDEEHPDDNSSEEASDSDGDDNEENEENEENEKALIDRICGSYSYVTDNPDEERTYEFSVACGELLMEVDTLYDYWGAEIIPLNAKDLVDENENEFIGTLYGFSGFSMAGEYWDDGVQCKITLTDTGLIIKTEGDSVEMIRDDDAEPIHGFEYVPSVYTPVDLEGLWIINSPDGENWYLEFDANGRFCICHKETGAPIGVYYGQLTEKNEDGTLNAVCERFAYGGVPNEGVLDYSIEEGKLCINGLFFTDSGIMSDCEDIVEFEPSK